MPTSNHVVSPAYPLCLRVQLHNVRLHLVKELLDVCSLVPLLGPWVDDQFSPVFRFWLLLKLDESESSLVKSSKVLFPCIEYCHIVNVWAEFGKWGLVCRQSKVTKNFEDGAGCEGEEEVVHPDVHLDIFAKLAVGKGGDNVSCCRIKNFVHLDRGFSLWTQSDGFPDWLWSFGFWAPWSQSDQKSHLCFTRLLLGHALQLEVGEDG